MKPTDTVAMHSALSIERALSRFGWLGDPDDLLIKLGINRQALRAIEADDEVSAAIDTRRAACTNTPWRIEHPQARVRRFFEDALRPHMTRAMNTAWAAVPYGYSVFEVVYAAPDDPANLTPGKIGIASIVECPFEWFRLRPGGALYWADDQQPADPRKFVATVRAGSLRKPMGEALLARAYWPWFFRTHGWKFWAKFLEQAAVPLLYGRTVGDKDGLLAALRSVTSGPVLVVGETDQIDSIDTPGNSPNKFTEFETACCRRIQRLILGQTLTSGTDGGSGNRALGQVHDEVRREKTRSDVLLVQETMQRLCNCLAALNGVADAPIFVMEDGAGLERERAERDKILVEAGMLRFTPEYLREKYALSESDFEVPSPASPALPAAATLAAQPLALADGDKPARPRFTAGQQAIEDEIARTIGHLPGPVDATAVARAIRGARDPDDLVERLGVVLVDADDGVFRRALERALFAADLMGYAQAQPQARRKSDDAPVSLHAPITIQMPPQPAPVVNLAAPQPVVQVDVHVPAQPAPVVENTINLPETQVSVTNEVQPAPVTTVVTPTHPARAVQTVERDPQTLEVVRTITTYEQEIEP